MKYVDMTEALRQVREKAPNTADAMARHKAGNAGFTDKAHLKAKGLIPRADGTKKISPKYESQKPYVSSHSGKDGKTVYDILDKDGKTDKSFNNKILAYDYFKKGIQTSLKNFAYQNSISNLKIVVSEDPDIALKGAASLCY